MIVVIPLGGLGKRFREAGYATRKPFLPLNGHCLIQRVLEQYHTLPHVKLAVVCLDEYRKVFAYAPNLWYGKTLHAPTQGPVETLLHATSILDTEEPVLIADGDSFLDGGELRKALALYQRDDADGGVTIRETSDPDCSYAIVTEGWIERTAEKQVISEWSTTGPYWWKRGRDFIRCATRAMQQGIVSISPVYNEAIQDELRIRAVPVTTFRHLGTPHAYESYRTQHLRPAL